MCGRWIGVALLGLAVGADTSTAAPPAISTMPVLNSAVLVADDTVPYTVTLVAEDGDGYADLREMRVCFNLTQANGNQANARGYLAWGNADGDITRFGGTWVLADATGGGRWGYRTDAWGGTNYIVPVSCAMTPSGSATGGSGSRTVTWTFTVKPLWAANPVMNDADAWVGDYATSVGWRDNPVDFDVVSVPCSTWATQPTAPVVGNATTSTLEVSIAPVDSASDLFAIRIAPPMNGMEYVQANGSVGTSPVWQTQSSWGVTTVQGVASSTMYTFTVRAKAGGAGACPSPWSAATSDTTALLTRTVDLESGGIALAKGLPGMDSQPKAISAQQVADTLAASFNTSMRFGGDGYNWKTRTAQWNSSTRSTLQALREARDRNSYLQICLNTRGIGTGNGSTWTYTDQTPETVAALAADWVYYCNVLVQSRRQGDVLTPREQSILDALTWDTDDKLLAPGEDPVPPVVYWEIGNEPEGPYPPPALTPEDYANRYSIITTAMLAEDPTIRVGPCVMSADNGNAWLDAVFVSYANRVDFVAYHPYGPMYWMTKNYTGGVLDAETLRDGLNYLKQQQEDRRQYIVNRLVAKGRSTSTPLIASEWNPSSWEGTYYYGLAQTAAQGLGVAETIFTFGELGFIAAQYWDLPNYPSASAVQIPGFKVFKALQQYMGDRLVDSLVDGDLRVYTTTSAAGNRAMVWAMNFSDIDAKPVRLGLVGYARATAVTQWTLANTSGDTSLITRNDRYDGYDRIDWTASDQTGAIDMSDFTLTVDDATLTLLVFDLQRLARVDHDRDGDVDIEDFGWFQACLTGAEVPSVNPDCQSALLDDDADVDRNDMVLFQACLTGPGLTADPACTD